jgi:hypothetical protein
MSAVSPSCQFAAQIGVAASIPSDRSPERSHLSSLKPGETMMKFIAALLRSLGTWTV